MRRTWISAVVSGSAVILSALPVKAGPDELTPPPPPAPKAVSELLYGVDVPDPYRFFESLDPAVIAWIRQEGAFTRGVLDAIPARARLAARLEHLHSKSPGIADYQSAGGRAFFRMRSAGADEADLFVRDRRGLRKLVDVHALGQAAAAIYSIDFFAAAPDGSKVAVGLSKNGSEDAQLSVFDAMTGQRIAGPIDRVQLGLLAWSGDGSTIYMNRLRQGTSASDLARYEGSTIDVWDLRTPPVTVLSHAALAKAGFGPAETPQVLLSPSSPFAALRLQNGAEPNLAIWIAPRAELATSAAWRTFIDRRDGVTAVALSGPTLFALSRANAPTFKLMAFDLREATANGRVVLPPSPRRVLESIHPAADGVYVVARQGLYGQLLRVRPDGGLDNIPLPVRGSISEAFSRSDAPGLTVAIETWTAPSRFYGYDPSRRRFQDLGLLPRRSRPPTTVVDLQVRASDGVEIPLTLLAPPGRKRSAPLLLEAYGSYGISMLPSYSPGVAALLQEGGVYAVCHVRGGGELGDSWRLAGKDENKPNTWRDLIACAETLLSRGLVAKDRLFILGGSAGGITVGRAMTERPDLFAGVIADVPPPNMLRLEFTPEGALETQEFGSVRTETGFRNLLAMDTYQHVKDGVAYPPILINMGLNDPRISPWQPAKLMARLLAAGDSTALLRVDVEGGHGIGATRTQYDELFADFIAFVFWRSGRPGWAPVRAPQYGSTTPSQFGGLARPAHGVAGPAATR